MKIAIFRVAAALAGRQRKPRSVLEYPGFDEAPTPVVVLIGMDASLVTVEPDFLNHGLRGHPAESGRICDDGEKA